LRAAAIVDAAQRRWQQTACHKAYSPNVGDYLQKSKAAGTGWHFPKKVQKPLQSAAGVISLYEILSGHILKRIANAKPPRIDALAASRQRTVHDSRRLFSCLNAAATVPQHPR
jgi:hypothetical protein